MMSALPPSFWRLPLPALHRQRQQGIASVLTMVLVGMALMASVMGAGYYIAARQSHSNSTHAQTQAQFNAWTGAHILQAYFEQLKDTDKLQDLLQLSTQPPIAVQLQASGMQGLVDASITHLQPPSADAPGRITAKITGTAAQDTRAQASALLEVVYELPALAAPQCPASAGMQIKGNLSITGGESGHTTPNGVLDIVVDGNLSISSASQALISACAKGNITISGGGVHSGGKLYSEQSIVLTSVTPPVNVDVWGQNVEMQNMGTGFFSSIRAGAYHVNIEDSHGNLWGSAYMGGRLMPEKDHPIPWSKGILLPKQTSPVPLFASLSHSDQAHWLLDVSKLQVNPADGSIYGMRQAATALISNPKPLPEIAKLRATSVHGGKVSLQQQNATQLWGYNLTLSGEKGNYQDTQFAGQLYAKPNALGQVLGGGDFNILGNIDFGIAQGSKIAGKVSNGSAVPNLQTQAAGTTPGLPGLPYCNVPLPTVHTQQYEPYANYVFKDVNGKPSLVIQDVSLGNTKLDGIYPLHEKSKVIDDLFYCEGKSCTLNSKWRFSEAFRKFPSGIFWFSDAFQLRSGINGGISGTIISSTSASNGAVAAQIHLAADYDEKERILKSPIHANLNAMCFSAAAKPNTLCTAMCMESSDSKCAPLVNQHNVFLSTMSTAEKKIESEKIEKLKALSKMAIITDGGLKIDGWKIYGNIQIGDVLSNGAGATHVHGTVATGLNTDGSKTNTLSEGGFVAITDTNRPELGAQIGSCPANPNTQGPITIKWSRYL